MQTYFKQLFAILLIGLSFATKAQNTVYPVQLNAVILPPFTNCLGDYVSPENNRFKLTALVRDLSYRNKLDVSVSLKVKSGNSVVLETKSPVQQTLEKVSVLTPIDTRALFDPNNPKGGLNYKGSYANNGWCLPEGYYEFVFQLFDYHDRKLPLSEPVSMFCYLAESEPPICVYPNANDCVDQPVINFQWMDASSMGIQQKKYVFELYEVGNYSKMAQVATMFGDKSVSGMTAVAKEVVFTNTYSFTLTNHLLEGHDYMWRVRVESKSGDQMAAYKNNGYSQWQMFTYVCKEHKKASTLDESVIPEIVSFTEVESVKGAGVVTWKANEHFCGYILKYQNKEYDLEEWASVNVSDSRVDNGDGTYSYTLDKLAEGETFLATITGIVNCNSDETRTTSPESEQKSVTLSKSSAASSESPKEEDGDCKVNVPEVQDNGDITELKEGDIFYANGNFVKVVGTPTNNGGKFTGKGIYSFSFLKGLVGVNVEYSDVRISMVDNINQLIEGEVKAVHDDNDNMMLNINSLINKSNTGTGECAVQTDITTTKMTQDEFDKMISSDQASSYVGVLIEVDNKDLYTVEDKGNGAYAQVKLGEVLDAEKFCKPLKNGLDSENDECVKFSPLADWNPPFDYECTPFCDNINTRNSYKKEDGYAVPWIAMPQNSYNTIKAEIRGNINTSDLAFYCYTDNKVVKLNAESKGNGTYEIKIFSGDVNYQLRIFAMYQKCDNQCEDLDKDCNNTKTLGRAQIYTLSRKTHKIKLVPVFKEITIDKSDLENKLNKLYEALGQKFELEVESTVFNDESIASLNADKAFELDDVSAFDRESASMTTLKNAYANSKTKDELKGYSAFIFILPSNVASSSSVKGEMPRSSSVGYVFGDGSYTDSHTLAHELAHGLFSMEHTFSIFPSVAQGSTDNLMDYGNKENLKYWQWLLVQNPKSYVLPFMDDASDAQGSDACALLENFVNSFPNYIKDNSSWQQYCGNSFGSKLAVGIEFSATFDASLFNTIGYNNTGAFGIVFFCGGPDKGYPYFYTSSEQRGEFTSSGQQIPKTDVNLPDLGELLLKKLEKSKFKTLNKLSNKLSKSGGLFNDILRAICSELPISLDGSVSISPFFAWQSGLFGNEIARHSAFAGDYQVVGLNATASIPEFPILKVGAGINFASNLPSAIDYYIDGKQDASTTFWSSVTLDGSVGLGIPLLNPDVDFSIGGGKITFLDNNVGEEKSEIDCQKRWFQILTLGIIRDTEKDSKTVDYTINTNKLYKLENFRYIGLDELQDDYYKESKNKEFYYNELGKYIYTFIQPDGRLIDLPNYYSFSFVGGLFNCFVLNKLADGVLMAFKDENNNEYCAKFSDDGSEFKGYYDKNNTKYESKLSLYNYYPYTGYYNVFAGIEKNDHSLEIKRLLVQPLNSQQNNVITNDILLTRLYSGDDANKNEILATNFPEENDGTIILPPQQKRNIKAWEDIKPDPNDASAEESILSRVFIRKMNLDDNMSIYQLKDHSFMFMDGTNKSDVKYYVSDNYFDSKSWKLKP